MADSPIDLFFELLFRLVLLVLRGVLNLLTLGRFGRWLDERAAAARAAAEESVRAFDKANRARDERSSAGWEHQLTHLVGKSGRTTTALRPLGRVEVEGDAYDARAEGAVIGPREAVRVVRAVGPTLFVRQAETTGARGDVPLTPP